jgi:hypothetical protein
MALLDSRRRKAVRRPLGALRRPMPEAESGRNATLRDPRALACFLLACLLLAGGLAHVLSLRSQRRSGTDGVWVQSEVPVARGSTVCQARELLPADTVTLQIPGKTRRPPVVTVREGARVLDRVDGTVGRTAIQAPVRPLAHDLANVELCIRFRAHAALLGGPTPPQDGALAIDGSSYEGSLAITYLLPGERSWWSFSPRVAARMGRGRGRWSAGWAAWLIAALVVGALALAGWTVLRTLVADRPRRRTALAVAIVAFLNAAAWSFITPAFQVPDEVAHVAYVQSVGETGAPPHEPRSIVLSPEQEAAMADTGFGSAFGRTLNAAAWSPLQQHRLAIDLRRPLSRRASVFAGEGEPEPPLYYTLESLPYRAASSATLLDRLTLMRLLSAAFAGITALLCFLFVRECLPGRPWAWTVGGLGVAFAPMLGFVSGGVNPDALLYTLSAALFLCVARAWRRGMTTRLALCAGALIAAGMLTKVNFYGLVPGALLGLTLAARRTTLAWDRRLARLLGATVAVGAALFALGIGFELLVWHRPFMLGRPASPESHVGLWSHVGYIWQVFLPRLPFQPHTTLTHPGYEQLFRSFMGVFGWMVVWLPAQAYRAAAAVLLLVGALAVRSLRANPRELGWRRRELLGYLAMAGALLLLIGLSADFRRDILHIVQGRYLLPLLPLFGILLALGARGAGDRWGRSFGVVLVAAAVAWSLLGQLVTIAFFYS